MEPENLQAPVKTEPDVDAWQAMQWLPCDLTLEVPVPHFTVGDLLRLTEKEVLDTRWSQGTEVPLRVNGQLIGWAEFEVIGERLAVRLMELA